MMSTEVTAVNIADDNLMYAIFKTNLKDKAIAASACWAGDSAKFLQGGRFRARSSSPGYPGAGSLAAAAGASKKSKEKIVPSASRVPCYE
jgi:hypothetical protein